MDRGPPHLPGQDDPHARLIRQTEESLITAFPKAVVYSDSGISLEGTSDVYAVKNDGITPWAPAPPWATTIMAGGGWRTGMPSSAKNFTANYTANLAAPSVHPIGEHPGERRRLAVDKFAGTIIGGVGLLSDYFDQAAQADLGDEAQAGEVHAAAPVAPAAPSTPVIPTPTPAATFSASERTDLTSTTNATAFTMTAAKKTGSATNINITRTTPRTYNFQDLYIRGNLDSFGSPDGEHQWLRFGWTARSRSATRPRRR